MDPSFYDSAYYLAGLASCKSNYVDYSWKPDLTLPMADWLKRILRIKDGDTLLDFGCARGYLVKALRMRGVNAFGYDSSEWAVENCDEGVKGYVSNVLPDERFDHIIAKDCLEHILLDQLRPLIKQLTAATRKHLLAIVPLTHHPDGPYLRDEDNSDPSHCNAWPLDMWMDLMREGVSLDEGYITGSWHYPGLKPASGMVDKSCGFLQFTRV